MASFGRHARVAMRPSVVGRRFCAGAFALLLCALSACGELSKPKPEEFFSKTAPPAAQEFRWGNGRSVRTLDPALASAPPETDAVRALFEGLTRVDPATAEPVAAAAESWTASDDDRTWTFQLRRNAKWTNGRPVTAEDFVRSWTRLRDLGDRAAHHRLLDNFVGVQDAIPAPTPTPAAGDQNSEGTRPSPAVDAAPSPTPTPAEIPAATGSQRTTDADAVRKSRKEALGVSARGQQTLVVRLKRSDPDLPKLVANPIFLPTPSGFSTELPDASRPSEIVGNGAFRFVSLDENSLVLERSPMYWNAAAVKLDRVRMVAMNSPDAAITAYRSGELDAVTNAEFSPLVLKMLTPFEDLKKRVHGALTFFEANPNRPPLSDRRVRQALSLSIERSRITETELEGRAAPANEFFPFRSSARKKLSEDKESARLLLEDAGFPDGAGFPTLKLVLGRNEMQTRVATAVTNMWRQNLGIEVQLVTVDPGELEAHRKSGDFDLIRRNVVFPSADKLLSYAAVFEDGPLPAAASTAAAATPSTAAPTPTATPEKDPARPTPTPHDEPAASDIRFLEDEAIYEARAIPLFFPMAYALVKPYVTGFEMDAFDAVDLTNVSIQTAAGSADPLPTDGNTSAR